MTQTIHFIFVKVALITTVFLLCAFSVDAEIYKWVDEYGKTQFTDNPPIDKKVEEVEVETIEDSGANAMNKFKVNFDEIEENK